jgi:hypothetical protein
VGIGHAVVAILAIALTSRAYLFRNYLVTVPVLCVGFGFTMQAATTAMASWGRRRGDVERPWPGRLLVRVPWLAAAFAIVYVAVPIGQAVRAQGLSLDARIRALDWISAQAGSHRVSVACSPDIISQGGYKSDWLRDMLKRPGVRIVGDVKDADDAARSHADYVLIVSHPDETGDFGDTWPFTEVKGYESVARFDASTYEHRWEITATWDGRFNVILLKRAESHGA